MTTNEPDTPIQQCLVEMEQLGMIRRTGEFRDGRPVFEITELGRAAYASSQLDIPTTKQ